TTPRSAGCPSTAAAPHARRRCRGSGSATHARSAGHHGRTAPRPWPARAPAGNAHAGRTSREGRAAATKRPQRRRSGSLHAFGAPPHGHRCLAAGGAFGESVPLVVGLLASAKPELDLCLAVFEVERKRDQREA